MNTSFYKSPIGILKISTGKDVLYAIDLVEEKGTEESCNTDFSKKVIKQLEEYFAGKLKEFDLPVEFKSSTEFQKSVYKELVKVEYGKTKSYKELAEMAKNPNACRAVGTALGKNPIPIVVPCHRIVQATGKIGHFSLGGCHVKKFLLELENNEN